MKIFNAQEYYTDFSPLPFSTICSFDNSDDQLAVLNRPILVSINQHGPLKRTKFTRPPAPSIKELDIIALQTKRNKYRFLAHNSPNKENRTNFRNTGNKLMKKLKIQNHHFTKRF